MTEREIRDALREIAEDAGPRAWANVSITPDRSGKLVWASLYPEGVTKPGQVNVEGDTFAEAIDNLGRAWEARKALADKHTIRKMALSIIEISTDQGKCSDAALRGAGFSQHQINAMGALACDEATRLAAGGPFSIVSTVGGNAPHDLVAA